MSPLANKCILFGVTGSIATYKAAELVSFLTQEGAIVKTIMTAAAQKLIAPLTFESISGQPVLTDLFHLEGSQIQHIALADQADLLVIAPATANILGKLAHGICDDALSTMACVTLSRIPNILAPAMNPHMYLNPIVQDNIKRLKQYGYIIVEPDSGHLACGTVGPGRLAEPKKILQIIEETLKNENSGNCWSNERIH